MKLFNVSRGLDVSAALISLCCCAAKRAGRNVTAEKASKRVAVVAKQLQFANRIVSSLTAASGPLAFQDSSICDPINRVKTFCRRAAKEVL